MGNVHLHFFCGVTAEAKIVAGFVEQGQVLGSMGLMTGDTFAFLKGLMFNFATGFQRFGFMTRVTKLAAFSRDGKGFVGCGIAVTLLTFNLINNRVCTRFEQFGLHRGVGVVAACAGRRFYRIIAMGPFKGGLLNIMAGPAQHYFRIFEQVRFIRTVCKVTSEAGLGF